MKPTNATWLKPAILARTRFFDEQVLNAFSKGISQVVICGAGYDDRPLRFRAHGVRFFELDHPETQKDKARRLREIGADMGDLVLIQTDFRRDDPAKLLGASSHRASVPTLFICEGLLAYLDRQTIVLLLGGLRSASATGSILAASLAVHQEGESAGQAVASANARRQTSVMEPWLTVLSPTTYYELFAAAGWKVEPSSVPSEIPGMLLITAHPN
jgi:methyltransferase (TIGR00027 family)